MHRLKRALAGIMASLLVLQCVPYATLADEVAPAASTAQTESSEVPTSDVASESAASEPAQSEPVASAPAQTEPVESSAQTPAAEPEDSQTETPDSLPAESSEMTEEAVSAEDEAADAVQPSSAPENSEAAVLSEQAPAVLSEQAEAAPLAQSVQLQDGTAVIPSDATEEEVQQILFDTLVANKDGINPTTLEWEYYCTGKNGWFTNDAWGSVDGFTSHKNMGVVSYTHPALSANNDGEYKVRLKDNPSTVATLTKTAKITPSLTVNENVTVALPYHEDGTIDFDALRQNIFEAAVADSTPALTVDDVTITYYAKATTGSWAGIGETWVSLEGDKISGLTYPAISAGDQRIKISYAGNDTYSNAEAEVAVTLTERSEAPYVQRETPDTVVLAVDENMDVDYDAVRDSIFNAVIESSDVLTPDNVTITYYAEATTGSLGDEGWDWMPLEGGSGTAMGIPVQYPAISVGTHDIRIEWAGNQQYAPTTVNATISVVDRPQADIELNEDPTVTLALTQDMELDIDKLYQDVFAAVIAGSTPELSLDDVTITYQATATTGSAGQFGKDWMPLEGGSGTVMGVPVQYPAISAGTQTIRIEWAGNQQYAPTTVETTVTVKDRPQADIQLNENPTVRLAVTQDLELDTDKLYSDVFAAVIAGSTPELSLDDVTITYYATATTGSAGQFGKDWMPLEGGSGTVMGVPVQYPAISAGTQTIRIEWAGNREYAPTTVETTVEVLDREQLQFTLTDAPYEVGMVFNAEQGYDYTATATAIYNAVVASTSPLSLTADDVTVEYNVDLTGITDSFKPLDQSDATGLVKFGTGDWEIRISWPGNQEYRGNSVIVDVTTTDNRLASTVVLKEGASFTYNMDASVMKQAILDNVIDWDNSTLPARETVSPDDFVIEYRAQLTDIESGVDLGLGDLGNLGSLISSDLLTQWVPIEGKVYQIGDTVLGAFPSMGAGEAQSVRISYKGNADYRPSENAEGTVTVNKAKVKVTVNSTNIYADESLPDNFITLDPADKFDVYTISAGVTSNVTTAIYLDLPDRYTNSVFLKVLDPVVEKIYGKSFTQMLNDGMTLGELRQLFSTQELLDLLGKLNIDTGTFGQILSVINNLPSITDSLRVSFGTPNRAGLYTVGVVTDSPNYETGVGMGFLLVKMRLSGTKLTWNQEISGKLTAEQAKNFDFGATLSYDGDVTIDQSGVHYLYSGFTSKWRIYSSTTTPPTEPGSYVVTVCILGGNHFAWPITRTFTITK